MTEEDSQMFVFEPGIELQEIVDAVNQVGASPSALIAILEALKYQMMTGKKLGSTYPY